MKKRIYISGAITGNENYKEEFAEAEKTIRAAGDIPINPAKLCDVMPESEWKAYMAVCIAILAEGKIDVVYFLKSWRVSLGSRIEHNLAENLNKQITFA